jgi:hypothetical protein
LKWVRETLHEVSEHAAEDPRAEYVYLLGVDRPAFEVGWYHLTFDAASGPGEFRFLSVQG